MSQQGKRKKWAAAEKLRIVLAGMQPNVEYPSSAPGRDQSDAVLRVEEATVVVGDQGVRRSGTVSGAPRRRRRKRSCGDEGRGGGDHSGEPGAKKRLWG